MSGSVVGTSDLPLELKGDPSCSEPDPDSLNLSSPPINAPDLAPSTHPAERVRAWARTGRRFQISGSQHPIFAIGREAYSEAGGVTSRSVQIASYRLDEG